MDDGSVTTDTAEESSGRRRTIAIAIVAVIVLIVVVVLLTRGGGSSSSEGSSTTPTTTAVEHRTLTIIFRIGRYENGPEFSTTGSTCSGSGYYAPIAQGAKATVSGPDGAVLASATFPEGKLVSSRAPVFSCAFTVSFDVPVVASYSLSAPGFGDATTSRPLTLDDVERDNWTFGLTTGYTG
jgi:hypothetical protein